MSSQDIQVHINPENPFLPMLRPGDTIALLSPSSRLNTIFSHRLTRSITYLTTLGFRIKEIYTPIPHPCSHIQQIQHRVQELHTAFSDPSVKGIICTIGGTSGNELLPFLDWDLIRREGNKKVFCGYSDITVLMLAMGAMCGVWGFYGPAALPQFGEVGGCLDFTVKHWVSVVSRGRREGEGEDVNANLIGAIRKMPRSDFFTDEFGDWENEARAEKEGILKPRKLEKNPGWKWLRQGKCEGRILGGCLPSLLQLAGTPYFPDFKDKILFLENPEGERIDGPLPLEQTRSLMVDLMNIGVWDEIVGLVVGRPTGYAEGEERTAFEEMVRGVCETREGWRFPILSGVDVGHTDPMVTIRLNAVCRLDSGEDVWEVLEEEGTG